MAAKKEKEKIEVERYLSLEADLLKRVGHRLHGNATLLISSTEIREGMDRRGFSADYSFATAQSRILHDMELPKKYPYYGAVQPKV